MAQRTSQTSVASRKGLPAIAETWLRRHSQGVAESVLRQVPARSMLMSSIVGPSLGGRVMSGSVSQTEVHKMSYQFLSQVKENPQVAVRVAETICQTGSASGFAVGPVNSPEFLKAVGAQVDMSRSRCGFSPRKTFSFKGADHLTEAWNQAESAFQKWAMEAAWAPHARTAAVAGAKYITRQREILAAGGSRSTSTGLWLQRRSFTDPLRGLVSRWCYRESRDARVQRKRIWAGSHEDLKGINNMHLSPEARVQCILLFGVVNGSQMCRCATASDDVSIQREAAAALVSVASRSVCHLIPLILASFALQWFGSGLRAGPRWRTYVRAVVSYRIWRLSRRLLQVIDALNDEGERCLQTILRERLRSECEEIVALSHILFSKSVKRQSRLLQQAASRQRQARQQLYFLHAHSELLRWIRSLSVQATGIFRIDASVEAFWDAHRGASVGRMRQSWCQLNDLRAHTLAMSRPLLGELVVAAGDRHLSRHPNPIVEARVRAVQATAVMEMGTLDESLRKRILGQLLKVCLSKAHLVDEGRELISAGGRPMPDWVMALRLCCNIGVQRLDPPVLLLAAAAVKGSHTHTAPRDTFPPVEGVDAVADAGAEAGNDGTADVFVSFRSTPKPLHYPITLRSAQLPSVSADSGASPRVLRRSAVKPVEVETHWQVAAAAVHAAVLAADSKQSHSTEFASLQTFVNFLISCGPAEQRVAAQLLSRISESPLKHRWVRETTMRRLDSAGVLVVSDEAAYLTTLRESLRSAAAGRSGVWSRAVAAFITATKSLPNEPGPADRGSVSVSRRRCERLLHVLAKSDAHHFLISDVLLYAASRWSREEGGHQWRVASTLVAMIADHNLCHGNSRNKEVTRTRHGIVLSPTAIAATAQALRSAPHTEPAPIIRLYDVLTREHLLHCPQHFVVTGGAGRPACDHVQLALQQCSRYGAWTTALSVFSYVWRQQERQERRSKDIGRVLSSPCITLQHVSLLLECLQKVIGSGHPHVLAAHARVSRKFSCPALPSEASDGLISVGFRGID